MTIELKIELLDLPSPNIWRQIKISPDITFHQLHQYIQAAFGWKNSHLYMFSENGFRDLINIGSPHDEEAPIDASKISAGNILLAMFNSYQFMPEKPQTLKYIYDFGDSWEHTITAVGFDRDDDDKPKLIDGQGACPPEDCGGMYGYEDIRTSLKTGEPSAIHGESRKPWLEGCGYVNYDPMVFDIKNAKKRLAKIK